MLEKPLLNMYIGREREKDKITMTLKLFLACMSYASDADVVDPEKLTLLLIILNLYFIFWAY